MQTTFNSSKERRCFTSVDLASGLSHLEIAEKDRHNTAFRDCDVALYKFIRAEFGHTFLPAAFSRVHKRALGPTNPDVVSWLDGILMSRYT